MIRLALVGALIASFAAQGASQEPPAPPAGAVERSELLALPTWQQSYERTDEIDREAARALVSVPPGARLVIVLGAWCPDSYREVPRFWRALDIAGEVPFEVELIAVDRQLQAEGTGVAELGVIAVPTFIVQRGGVEVGRVVETAVSGVESDVLALLRGEAEGTISATR